MRTSQIEAWALRTIEAVLARRPAEDSTVELKTEWPAKPSEIARRLAGHANAARGDPILWLIGVNEGAATAPGVAVEELSNWWAQVVTHFADGIHPAMQDVVVPFDGASVVALAFETDRPPYAVRPSGQGAVSLEVPWREGTAIRSAKRRELLLLLDEAVELPEIEIFWARLDAIVAEDAHDVLLLSGSVDLYMDSVSGKRLTFPFHRCTATIWGSPSSWSSLELEHMHARGPDESPHAVTTGNEMILTGPAALRLDLSGSYSLPPEPPDGDLELKLELWPTRSDLPVRCAVTVRFLGEQPQEAGSTVIRRWRWDTR